MGGKEEGSKEGSEDGSNFPCARESIENRVLSIDAFVSQRWK